MNQHPKAKMQSRILLVSAALLVCLSAVLILSTVHQHRREKPLPSESVPLPPETTAAAMPQPAETAAPMPKEDAPTTEASAETEIAVSVSGETDILPDFISPLSGCVSRRYETELPVYSVTMNDYRIHRGVDISAPIGEPVRAAAAGVVGEVWDDPMMGRCVSILHAGGARSIYRNLAPELPEEIIAGASVAGGSVIGAVGESALIESAEESHLHYELEIGGVSVDPAQFMLLPDADTAYEG